MMKGDKDEESNIYREEFDDVLAKFKRNNKPTYKFLVNAGESFKTSMYKLCRRLIRDESFPVTFLETILKQLWKKKGSREVLDNHRFIHLKQWKPRLTETLVTKMMKKDIIKAGTKYQIGGILCHHIEEHLIVLKSFIMLRSKTGEGVVIQLVDFQIFFFDSESLRAVMASLNVANVNNKAYRCWYNINKTAAITVDTPVGKTEKATVHEIVPQGSGGAALGSALDLALGLKCYFSGSADEICYGKIRSQPQAWQDDILRVAESINSTRIGNTKLASMTAEKGLKAHQTKTTFVIIGTRKYREKMTKEAEANPVYFGSFVCQPSVSEIYLGEVIHSEGLEAGLEATINHRLGKVRGAMYKAKALMEDFRLQAITGMEGAWII